MTDAAPAPAQTGGDAVAQPDVAPAPSAAPVPAAADALKGSGDDWRVSLPDDLRAHDSLKDVPDVATLAKRFIDNHKMARSRVPLPDGSDESFTAFANAIRPASADDYKIELPDGMDGGFADHMRPVFHEAGLHPRQVDLLVKANNDYAHAVAARDGEALAAFSQTYQGDYEADRQRAIEALTALNAPHEALVELGTKWGSPALMEWAINLGKRIGPLNFTVADTQGHGSGLAGLSPEAAQAKLDQLRSTPEWYAKAQIPGSAEERQFKDLVAAKARGRFQQQKRS